MKAFVFDTETTGLWNNRLKRVERQPYIVEFYGETVDIDSEKVLDSFHSYFRPGVKMDAGAKKVTGLTDEFLLDKPSFKDKVEDILSLFDGVDYIVGQNIRFDTTMLEFEFARSGINFEIPKEKFVDTVEATEHIFGYRCKLSDLYEHFFGERFSGAHEASFDVKATTRIFLELLKREEI